MILQKCIDLLGMKVKDKITGATGVVTSLCFDLFGCIQVIVTPGKVNKNGQEVSSIGWIDINRLEIKKSKRVMEHPNFELKYSEPKKVNGPANKPMV